MSKWYEKMYGTYTDQEPSIYAVGNPYGYRYNIGHPRINRLYKRYMVWKGIEQRPLTDAERLEFEKYLDEVFSSGNTPPV